MSGGFFPGGLFPDLLVCGLCGPPLLTKLAIKSETLLSTGKKKKKKNVSSCTKEEAGFSGFNFSAAGFWI